MLEAARRCVLYVPMIASWQGRAQLPTQSLPGVDDVDSAVVVVVVADERNAQTASLIQLICESSAMSFATMPPHLAAAGGRRSARMDGARLRRLESETAVVRPPRAWMDW